MKFLRTAPTGRLLATLLGLVLAVAAGTAIAVAATTSDPVPAPKKLATAVHSALSAPAVAGISADISFTNNLISSDDFIGQSADPILQGATGRLWLTDHHLRLELQSDNGDAQVVVNDRSFWISDPSSNTVYEGTLPAGSPDSKGGSSANGVPTVARIQSEITRLMQRVTLRGAGTSDPTDVAGRAAYSVQISPKHAGGELGSLQLAWDAATGTPLNIAVYARNSTTPVLQLKATNISYGAVPASDFAITPPAGDKVIQLSSGSEHTATTKALKRGRVTHTEVSGAGAVARHVPFTLAAPASLVGLPRHGASLLNWGGKPAALLTYGQGLGGLAVIEQSAGGAAARTGSGQNGGTAGGLSLPTVSINGATGQELDTSLGTMVRFTKGNVAYTVIGSVAPYAADQAARALAP
jgi:outer membrane lipoprotein-sorting protein